MTIKVPLIKDSKYSTVLFLELSKCISKLAYEYGKWPDVLSFSGRLGKEIIEIIEEKKWDFSKFKVERDRSPQDQLMIYYSKPLDEIEDRGVVRHESLHGKIIEGIPGSETIGSITGTTSSPTFRIHRKIRPKEFIKLIR